MIRHEEPEAYTSFLQEAHFKLEVILNRFHAALDYLVSKDEKNRGGTVRQT